MPEATPNALARQLVDRFRQDNWRFRKDDGLIQSVHGHPDAVVEFMRLVIDEWPPE